MEKDFKIIGVVEHEQRESFNKSGLPAPYHTAHAIGYYDAIEDLLDGKLPQVSMRIRSEDNRRCEEAMKKNRQNLGIDD